MRKSDPASAAATKPLPPPRSEQSAPMHRVCLAMGWVGGGDAKVAASTALWFGFADLMNYLVYASLFGGALTLLLLQFRQWPLPYALAGQTWLLHLHDKESGIPYGIALALGALA